MIPEEMLPEGCRTNECTFGFLNNGIFKDDDGVVTCNLLQAGSVCFEHRCNGHVDRLFIPESCLMDVCYDLWGQKVKPWIDGLHREEGLT
jgi:hypothetical protein